MFGVFMVREEEPKSKIVVWGAILLSLIVLGTAILFTITIKAEDKSGETIPETSSTVSENDNSNNNSMDIPAGYGLSHQDVSQAFKTLANNNGMPYCIEESNYSTEVFSQHEDAYASVACSSIDYNSSFTNTSEQTVDSLMMSITNSSEIFDKIVTDNPETDSSWVTSGNGILIKANGNVGVDAKTQAEEIIESYKK